MNQIMSGIRILEVADFVFVPAAGAILSDWGAEVIKVEHHERGDHMRGQTITAPANKTGFKPFNALMENANRGKRSIGLNLASSDGRDVLMRLAKTSDVFLTSKLAPVRQKLAIDLDDVRDHNASIIYARGSGRGERGAEAGNPGFDIVDYWFRSGAAAGATPREVTHLPTQPGYAFGDLTGSMNLAGGILGALYHRERTGEALTVDTSLLATGLWSMSAATSIAHMYGEAIVQPAAGSVANALSAPYQCSDGRWISLCCNQPQRYWQEFCAVIGRRDLSADGRYGSPAGFAEHSATIAREIGATFAERPMAEWADVLSLFSGPWTKVQDALEVAEDPQVRANGYVVDSKSSEGEEFLVVQPPVQFGGVSAPTRPAPQFNDSADALLSELGMSDEDILDLRVGGALA